MKQTLLLSTDGEYESYDCNVARSCSDSQIHEIYNKMNQEEKVSSSNIKHDNQNILKNQSSHSNIAMVSFIYKVSSSYKHNIFLCI